MGEVVEYVRDYAIQETVGPLKGAGRWLGFGAGGAALLGLGIMLLMLGLLRLIQSEWDGIAEGGTSWIPYVIVLVVTVLLIVITLLAGAAGVVAAVGPARRAAKLDVLDAISTA